MQEKHLESYYEQINHRCDSITALFVREPVSGEANKTDRGVNTNLHPLFVSSERRRKKHRNLIGLVHRLASVIRRAAG